MRVLVHKQAAIVHAFYNQGVKSDICIRGAGVVGKVLALLLARTRVGVTLVMPKSPAALTEDIRSYALNAASRQLLQSLRVWPEQASAVQQMCVMGDDRSGKAAQVQFASPEKAQDGGALAWIVDAQLLERNLTTALSFSADIALMDQAAPAQLTVICEGKHSITRAATGAHYEQFAYGQSAVAAHITCNHSHQATAWQWMRNGEVCALLPRGQAVPGNSVALVWSVSHDRAQSLLDLPPDAFIAQLQEATSNRLGAMQLSSMRAAWPLSVAQAEHWSGQAEWGTWVLAGDAAHAIHPLAGQGLNLGLQDARELAEVLSSKPYFRAFSDSRLLRSYERSRKAEAAVLRAATDGLHQLFVMQDVRVQALRNWGMSSFDAAVPLKRWVMQRAAGRMSKA
ncbi:MAG: ubiquinone biosynthesis protein UbiH [Anaerolineae bacterium]|nr:ubiquinone biosynthesis protein UbiH [Anaerolineae bacterium]